LPKFNMTYMPLRRVLPLGSGTVSQMVVLNKIYTRTGDAGTTRLSNGEEVAKFEMRVEAYGTVDEANSVIGVARRAVAASGDTWLDEALGRIQNDLFDLGADLATPPLAPDAGWTPLRVVQAQVDRLETEIDHVNDPIPPLDSFVLPGGSEAAAHLHVARTLARRAERQTCFLAATNKEAVSGEVIRYLNRLSDFLFVAARRANGNGSSDVKWVPGANR
jgi:cob(I)alamin adenosyltransferase